MLGHALAHLGWAPETFWRATPHEYLAANEAQVDANEARERAMRERR